MQEIYKQPIKEELILKRIQEIKRSGGIAAVSGTPLAAIKYKDLVKESEADLFFFTGNCCFYRTPGQRRKSKS